MQRGSAADLRVVYLCDLYPAVSHTFVQREVQALRDRGAEVETISIRRSPAEHVRSTADRHELERTHALLPVPSTRLLATHLRALFRSPRHYVATLLYALRLGLTSPRGPLWHIFYFAEAILVWAHCERLGMRHVHAHFVSPSADVALLAAHFGKVLDAEWGWSFSAHGTDMLGSSQRVLAEKVERANFVVCVSDYGRSQLMAVTAPSTWERVHRVRTGVDLEAFDAPPRAAVPRQPLALLNVGRLHPVKGHAVLLDALALLLSEPLDLRLTIVGDGPSRAELEERARRLQIADVVTFAGSVGQDDIRRYYASADVFCLSSFGEGVPVVLMEAMAMRLPVIASRIMGIPELVCEGKDGLLVTPARADELAAALRRLATDPEMRRSLGQAARGKVEREFDARVAADQLVSLLSASANGTARLRVRTDRSSQAERPSTN